MYETYQVSNTSNISNVSDKSNTQKAAAVVEPNNMWLDGVGIGGFPSGVS